MFTDVVRTFKSKLQTSLNSTDRRAKIQDSDFIVAILQAVAEAKKNFTLGELHRSVCLFLEKKITRSAFNERLGTASLVKSLQMALQILMTISLTKNLQTKKLLKKIGVREIVGVDASLVTLWDGLKDHFKGTFMNASVKLHLAIDLVSGTVKWFNVTDGATHDSRCFPGISIGYLFIFDLGYWSKTLLKRISENGAFFLSRIKASTKLTVTEVVSGMGNSIVGKDLLRFNFERRRKTIVELMATMNICGVDVVFRTLGFWHKEDRKYRWYITNLKCARGLIYDLYRLRWQIEVCFKSMKSSLNFDRIPTLNPNAVEVFVLIALINYIFAILVRDEAVKLAIQKRRAAASSASVLRAAKLFANTASAILALVLIGKRVTKAAIARLKEKVLPLLSEVLDPNFKKRNSSLKVLQCA